jgi:hypothetical protein
MVVPQLVQLTVSGYGFTLSRYGVVPLEKEFKDMVAARPILYGAALM